MPTSKNQLYGTEKTVPYQAIYNRAIEHHSYIENKRTKRNFEAFLMLAVLIEDMIVSLGRKFIKENTKSAKLHKKKDNDRYSLNNAIDDLYLMKAITEAEFNQLEDFRQDRNNLIHQSLKKGGDEEIEEYAKGLFKKHSEIFDSMIKKLRKNNESYSSIA